MATTRTTVESQQLQTILQRSHVHYSTISGLAYSVLRQAVLTGVFKPGQQLRQDSLAEALGISRIPIRSALFQLEADGLLELRPHRGAVVKQLTSDQVRNIYEARIVLETYALRKAIEVMTPEQVKRLHRLAAKLDAAKPGDSFVDAGSAFYRELYAVANPVIGELSARLRDDVGRYWLRPRVVHGVGHTHTKLMDYIERRDADAAVKWLEGHLNEVCEHIVELIGQSHATSQDEA